MKSKYLLFAILAVGIAAMALAKPAEAHGTPVAGATDICFISEADDFPPILCEPAGVDFPARIITVSGNEKNKTYERLFKHKLSVTKNYKLELSVGNYLFLTESLTHYNNNLNKLRRLNI